VATDDTPPAPPQALPALPLATRLWFAWLCFFRVLFDGGFAARVWGAREAAQLPPSPERKPAISPKAATVPMPLFGAPVISAPAPRLSPSTAALQLLSLLQREGRLVDFLEQEIAAFSDADVGAAARVVHEGCRKALHAHAKIEPVRGEAEGARVTLQAGFAPDEVKLLGDVRGAPPYDGVLRHRGWRASKVELPQVVGEHDMRILAPAEVELG
jgi:hypothetical protein